MSKNVKNLIVIILILLLFGWIYMLSKDIWNHIIHSLKRITIWFSIASVCWIFLWFTLGVSKKLHFLKYLVEILRPIPPIARIPLAILRFWLWDPSSYFIVFIGSFFPIFTNTYFWIISIPQMYMDISNNIKLNAFDFYYRILWIYALPYIFSWLKIWLWMWWMSLIAAELIWAQSWLGYYIQINRLMLNMGNVVLWMILIGIIWFLLNYWLNKAEWILVRWK